jgi:hypothetical protein
MTTPAAFRPIVRCSFLCPDHPRQEGQLTALLSDRPFQLILFPLLPDHLLNFFQGERVLFALMETRRIVCTTLFANLFPVNEATMGRRPLISFQMSRSLTARASFIQSSASSSQAFLSRGLIAISACRRQSSTSSRNLSILLSAMHGTRGMTLFGRMQSR